MGALSKVEQESKSTQLSVVTDMHGSSLTIYVCQQVGFSNNHTVCLPICNQTGWSFSDDRSYGAFL
jgi:hypothetical protein